MSTSKISLLPEDVRQQVNRRLQAGESASRLAEWLNALPEAQAALAAQSTESTVKAEDVANWQQGGYRDWLAHQAAMAEVRRVVAEAKELSKGADGALTDNLAAWTAGRYAIATRQLAAKDGNGPVDWNLLRALCHDLVDLRRGDHSAEKLRMERERLEMDRAEQKEHLEKQFWEWAKQHREKICQGAVLSAEEKEARIRQIFGLAPPADREAEKIDKVREALFGEVVPDGPPTTESNGNEGPGGRQQTKANQGESR
jgi:hypothetical protein